MAVVARIESRPSTGPAGVPHQLGRTLLDARTWPILAGTLVNPFVSACETDPGLKPASATEDRTHGYSGKLTKEPAEAGKLGSFQTECRNLREPFLKTSGDNDDHREPPGRMPAHAG